MTKRKNPNRHTRPRTGPIVDVSKEKETRAKAAKFLTGVAAAIRDGEVDALEVSTIGVHGIGGGLWLFPDSNLKNAQLSQHMVGVITVRQSDMVEVHRRLTGQHARELKPVLVDKSNGGPS